MTLAEHLVARHGYAEDVDETTAVDAHRWMHRRFWMCHHHGEPEGGRDPPGWETGEGVVDRDYARR